jgi:hypothetical protein
MTNDSDLARELSGVENLEVPDWIMDKAVELINPITEVFNGLLQPARDAGAFEQGVRAAEIQGDQLGVCLGYLAKSCFLLGFKRRKSGRITELTDKAIKDSAKHDFPYLEEAAEPLGKLVGMLFSGLVRMKALSENEANMKAQDIGKMALKSSIQFYSFGAEYSQRMDK